MALLEVRDLSVAAASGNGPLSLVRNVSFSLDRGQILGIVGESGCGKSTTALAMTRLLAEGVTASGHVCFDNLDLLRLTEAQMCRIRGDRISMIFQEPMTALNPLKTIGAQVAEPLRLHRQMSARASMQEAIAKLERVGILDAAQKARSYPHELSGGQRQRVVIAIALACEPDLIVADEPTTALDTTVQRQIIDLLLELVDETGIALALITHNLAVVSEIADRVLIMYRGSVVEAGPAETVLNHPQHPYTRGLLHALPQFGAPPGQRLEPIAGTVPPIQQRPVGCSFAERCSLVDHDCRRNVPNLRQVGLDHTAACLRLEPARIQSEGKS